LSTSKGSVPSGPGSSEGAMSSLLPEEIRPQHAPVAGIERHFESWQTDAASGPGEPVLVREADDDGISLAQDLDPVLRQIRLVTPEDFHRGNDRLEAAPLERVHFDPVRVRKERLEIRAGELHGRSGSHSQLPVSVGVDDELRVTLPGHFEGALPDVWPVALE